MLKNRESLPTEVNQVLQVFISGLHTILGDNLYGAYMYGAVIFPNTGPVQDIDCHVILRESLTEEEHQAIHKLFHVLEFRYPALGGDLDAYFILLAEAQSASIPTHQLNPAIVDNSWALHCAHIRAGYYLTLWGPEPEEIFPTPSWPAITSALEHELGFVRENLRYPAYCILNLCRILYTFTTQDAVVSKQFSGRWACGRFPEWEPIIQAAIRFYLKASFPEDDELLSQKVDDFLMFMEARIAEIREISNP